MSILLSSSIHKYMIIKLSIYCHNELPWVDNGYRQYKRKKVGKNLSFKGTVA